MYTIKNLIKNKFKGLTSYHMYDTTKSLLNNETFFSLSSKQVDPFFIIGSGRSGNTLLRSMLVEGDGVVIPPESYVLGNVIRKYYELSHFQHIQWNEICAITLAVFDGYPEFKWWDINVWNVYDKLKNIEVEYRSLAYIIKEVYNEYAIKNAVIMKKWGDKTPLNTFHLNKIHQTFPNAKFVHIIRDGRDVAVSYKKAKLYQSLEEACTRWNDSVNEVKMFSKKILNNKLYEIKYEMLVSNPREEIKNVCNFLGIDFKESMLNRSQSNHLGDVSGLNHHKNVKNPINSSSIGKWRNTLSEEEKKTVNNLCYRNLKKLGYPQ